MRDEAAIAARKLEALGQSADARLEHLGLLVLVLARLDLLHHADHRVGRVEEREGSDSVGVRRRGELGELLQKLQVSCSSRALGDARACNTP